MNLKMLRTKVRAHARDFNNTIFRQEDIDLFLNEGIDRIIQVLPQLNNISYLVDEGDVVNIIPREYSHLLASYAVARLFSQDERHYEATNFMNEFETKISELKTAIENRDVKLIDPDSGEELILDLEVDYVTDNYFTGTSVEEEDEFLLEEG
jgi:hypothetical protein